ncbi:MAG TPA: ice-binding family protein [Ktedonobacterales bacterium]|nr:ice-binding family protein [Ktedonobacterales bacterium]
MSGLMRRTPSRSVSADTPSASRTDGEQAGKRWKSVRATALVLALLALFGAPALTSQAVHAAPIATSPVLLGTATSYGVLAGDSISNTGATTVNGDLGLYPGTSVGGGITVSGTSNVTNPAAHTAKNDLRTAYLDAAGRSGGTPIVADLGGTSPTPGVYNTASGIGITGALTLNAQGNANAVWIFQAGSTLTANTSSSVVLTNGAQACNVFWQIGSAATLDASTTFAGTVMAHDNISVLRSVTVVGRLLAGAQANGAGALTLNNDIITKPTCAAAPTPTPTPAGVPGLDVAGAGSAPNTGSPDTGYQAPSGSSNPAQGSSGATRATGATGAAASPPKPVAASSGGLPLGWRLGLSVLLALLVTVGGGGFLFVRTYRRRRA